MEVLFDFYNNGNTPLGLKRPVFNSYSSLSFSPNSQTSVYTQAFIPSTLG